MSRISRRSPLSEWIVAIVMLALPAWYFESASTLSANSLDPLGAAFYPELLAAGSAVCGLIVLVRLILRPSEGKSDSDSEESPAGGVAAGMRRALVIGGLGVAFVLFQTAVSYPIALFLMVGLILVGLGERKPVPVLFTAVGSAVILYGFFARFLGVPLPTGFWGG